jgi:hypothetical protein
MGGKSLLRLPDIALNLEHISSGRKAFFPINSIWQTTFRFI